MFLAAFLAAAAGVLFLGSRTGGSGIDFLVGSYVPPGAATPSGATAPRVPRVPIIYVPKTVHVPILMYHYIEYNHDPKDTIRISLTVTPFWLEKQLQYLADNGYTTISPAQLAAAVDGRASLPAKPVVLTFDDGYRDFYTDAWPLLEKYHARATTYVVADFLDKPNYMFSWQLERIATESGGLIDIGAHTRHHVGLALVSPERAWDEIFHSKTELEEKIGRPVTDFAYPYGNFNQTVAQMVARAGFLTAAATIFGETEGPGNLFFLPRVRVGNYAGEAFQRRLDGK